MGENLVEKLKAKIEEAKKAVEETGTPTSIEIMRNDRWVVQLLVTPPSTQQYGAVSVKRDAGVLLSVRSTVNWRNNLTIPDERGFNALVEVINDFNELEELRNAVLLSLTGRSKAPVKTTITL